MSKLYLSIKTLHIIAMVCWFAGLFYLPRLFVYHAMAQDEISKNHFKIMEHKLFWFIMTPAAIVTVISGKLISFFFNINGNWLHIKMIFVLLLIIYHVYCFKLIEDFSKDCNFKSHRWYRLFNEIPTIILILCVTLTIFKPF